MKILNLNIVDIFNKNIEGNKNDIGLYTYNVFNKKFDDYDKFVYYLNWEIYKSDLNEVENYIKYIYNIIENSDFILVNNLADDELNNYISNLKYTYYNKITLNNSKDNIFNTNYLFDIRDVQAKQFVKDNLKFNLCDEYREPMIIKTDRKYILNDDDREYLIYDEGINSGYAYCDYCFVKDNCLQLIMYQRDGYIDDYRHTSLIEKN